MTATLDTAMLDIPALRRIEERAFNVTQTARARMYDGWVLRLAPGASKRGRSVNALYAGTLPVAGKIAHCEAVYAEAGLPAVFRVTPFDHPRTLDAELAARGYAAFDTTDVLVARLVGPAREAAPTRDAGRAHDGAGVAIATPDLDAFAAAVAAVRGDGSAREALVARLRDAAVHWRGFVATRDGVPLACGQLAWEERAIAGLFDIVVADGARRQGIGMALCRAMLDRAWSDGVGTAYLQVVADNAAAQALYRRLGFADGYRYHYRARPGEMH